jgi:hypothetical protein
MTALTSPSPPICKGDDREYEQMKSYSVLFHTKVKVEGLNLDSHLKPVLRIRIEKMKCGCGSKIKSQCGFGFGCGFMTLLNYGKPSNSIKKSFKGQ